MIEDSREDDADLTGGRTDSAYYNRNEVNLGPEGRTEEEYNEGQPLAVEKDRRSMAPDVQKECRRRRVDNDATGFLKLAKSVSVSRKFVLVISTDNRNAAMRADVVPGIAIMAKAQ